MKKLISIILLLSLVLGLCACGGNGGGSKKDQLLVGYSRQSIMPVGSVGLGGYSNAAKRMSTNCLDFIYTTCIAFTYGEETILLFTEDLIGKGQKMTGKVREAITEATGIPGDHIMASGTHTHSAPDTNISENNQYKELFIRTSVLAAQKALEDQAPATIYAANVMTEGLNFIRHYREEDGSITSSNLGNINYEKVVDHAREADKEMVLVKFQREDDKKDIMLMNWAAHPTTAEDGGSTGTTISADYIGTARDAFERDTGMHFAFFQGGGGDAVTDSRIASRANNLDRKGYGEALSKVAVEALPTLEEVPCDGIQIQQNMFEYEANHYGQERLEDAQKVMELYKKAGASTATILAHELGFVSYTQCRSIVNCSTNPATSTMELDAFRIGEVGFATAPWEMCSNTSMQIKDGSPYKYTMVLSIANGRSGYLPIKEAFEYVSYEAFSSSFNAGGAEAAAEQLIGMLKSFQ